jgi:replicative DNA helicase
VKRLPHNEEIEREVLGSVLLQAALGDAADLEPEDFFDPNYQVLWRRLLAMVLEGRPLEIGFIFESLRANRELAFINIEGLSELSDYGSLTGAALLGRQAAALKKLAAERRIIAACEDVIAQGLAGCPDLADYAEAAMLRARANAGGGQTRGPRQLAKTFFTNMQRRSQGEEPCVVTPWEDLNALLGGGLQRADLVIIAGRPSMGKTTLGMNIASHASMPASRHIGVDGQVHCLVEPALVFSLEMSEGQLLDRVFAAESPVVLDKVRRPTVRERGRIQGRMLEDEQAALRRAGNRLLAGSLYINDASSPTVVQIAAAARRWRADRSVFTDERQTGLILVDYIGLIPSLPGGPKGRTREQEMAEISKALKALARELQLPVLVVSQLNRQAEGRQDKRPQLSDLRDSGALEQDADVVLLAYREEYYLSPEADEATKRRVANMAECIVAKQRNGATDTVRLRFAKTINRFDGLVRGGLEVVR